MVVVKMNAKKKKNFRWDSDMVGQLIDCLIDYKAQMAYKGLDFDGDKPMQYKEVRLRLAKCYEEEVSLFGPYALVRLPDNFEELSKDEQESTKEHFRKSKELITKGTNRVMEKVKEIRQNFSKAVISGQRSGSGKFVYEFYDKLVQLWGGSANVAPLPYGVRGDDFGTQEESGGTRDTQDESSNPTDEQLVGNEVDGGNDTVVPPTRKRKSGCIPQLVDNKRRHLERNLSAAQRDKMLIEESKQDAQFKKDLTESIRESSSTFAQGIKNISEAITSLSAGLHRSIELMAHAIPPNPQPINQNMFYQNPISALQQNHPTRPQDHMQHQGFGSMHHHHYQ